MSLKKKVILVFSIVVIIAALTMYKMWTKPHINVQQADAVAITSKIIATEFETDETAANRKYLNKVISILGTVNDVTSNTQNQTVVTLNGSGLSSVMCTMDDSTSAPGTLKNGMTAAIKGICTGYLTDVVLVRCVIEKK
jgi:hypothetical protein